MTIEDLERLMRALNGLVLLALLYEWGRNWDEFWPFEQANWRDGPLAQAFGLITALCALVAGVTLGTGQTSDVTIATQTALLAYGVVVAALIWLRYRN